MYSFANVSHYALVNWIIENRKGDAFKSYLWTKIAMEIAHSFRVGVFLISHDDKDEVNGVVCGTKDEKKKEVYIWDILTTDKSVLRTFVDVCKQRYPDFTIKGRAHGRVRLFANPQQLLERL